MPITASYSSATRRLSVLADAASNSIIFTRDPAGTIFINGGAVPVSAGPATVVNTDLIEAFGLDLNDVITLDETNGALPAANFSGGTGNDTLTGGTNGDTLSGDAGADVLLGRAGVDQLLGGNDGDTLTGGDGNDTMSGEAGNDRMIWNPGDDNDVMEGGLDTDIAEINGGSGDETFQISQNGTRVAFERVTPAPFTIDIGTTESLLLNASGGNDIVNTVGNFVGLITLTLDGGAGNDTINGSNNADLLLGGDGNDLVDGNAGADTAFLGANDDTFRWDPGDGSDIVEGQAGLDLLHFNGSNASENIQIAPNGGRTQFFRDVAAITMDIDDVEQILYRALGGTDNVVVADLTGTDTTAVTVDLSGPADPNLGDGALDSVTADGTAGADTITATAAVGSVAVTGLPALTTVLRPEGTDRLVLSGQAGNDTISASGIAAGQIAIELLGGLGTDVLIGSDGNDRFLGGDGNDTALMGAGDDEFVWNPGDDLDIVEGQAGTDTLTFNGNSAAENVSILPNGGRLTVFRDVGAVTMDLNDVEHTTLSVGGGIDTVTINDVSGTDASQFTINLASSIGGTAGDAANDVITANATAAANTIALSGGSGTYTLTGMGYALTANQVEALDTLVVLAGGGADIVSAVALSAATTTLQLHGQAGADNIVGSSGADLLLGGTENDILTAGPGNDTMQGEDGNDLMVWNPGDGTDVLEGGNGSDNAQVNGGNGGEAFLISANVARVNFERLDPAPFALDIGTTETLILFANGGNDTVTTSGNLAALISLSLDGGAGNDTILAGNGSDVILGGTGDDFVDGNQGFDTVLLGDGNDVFQWDPGDGSDLIEGQVGTDALIFNGNGANEIFGFTPSSGRTQVTRDVGVIALDTNDVEQVIINAGAGTDIINVPDLGTEVGTVSVNLSAVIGGSASDAQFDTVTFAGNGLDNLIAVSGSGSAYSVSGLPVSLTVNANDPSDSLSLNAAGGNDIINAVSLGAGVVTTLLNGGAGDDRVLGGGGGDTILGDAGNDIIDGNAGGDVAFLGDGNDAFVWDPGDGSDVIEGQTGTDTLLFNGSNANEVISISPNGGRAVLQRDVASIVMDMDDMEAISISTFGGSDIVIIGDLAGTDVNRVVVNLAAASGGADGVQDFVNVTASAIGDIVDVHVLASGAIEVTGTAAAVEIRNFDALDRLTIDLGDGNDTIDATGTTITLSVFGGAGDDTITGGLGRDTILPGPGINTVFLSPGPDLLDSVGGTTTVFI